MRVASLIHFSLQSREAIRRIRVALARQLRSPSFVLIASLLFLLALVASSIPVGKASGDEKKSADPWPSSQTLEPARLAKMLTDKDASVPAVVFVGFRSLYAG